jgi:hypothetical protein
MKNLDDTMLAFEYGPTGEIKYHTSDYFHMWLENTRIKNLSKNSFIRRLMHVISLCGAKINHFTDEIYTENTGNTMFVEGELSADLAEIKSSHDAIKIEIKVEAYKKIAEAKELTEAEIEEIQTAKMAQTEITEDQKYAYEKHMMRQHYNYQQDPEGNDMSRGAIDEKFVAKYRDPKVRRIYRNLCRVAGVENIEDAIKQIQREERANYVYVMGLDERAQHADVNRKYVFEHHRWAFGLLKACGWNNINDPKFMFIGSLADNIRTNEKIILATVESALSDFSLRKLHLPTIVGNRDNDEKYVEYMLININKIINAMYGIRIGAKRDEKEMYMLHQNKLFTYNPNDAKKRPVIRGINRA